jgi:hypothetical protein
LYSHKRIQSTLHSFFKAYNSLVVVFCVHVHEERTKKQHIMRICGFDKEKVFLTNYFNWPVSTGASKFYSNCEDIECRRSSFMVVLCAVMFVSIIKSDAVGYISYCFLVEIRGVVFHIRIVQVILTRAEQVVGSF